MTPDDHEARMLAQRAHDRITGHEDLCSERWRQSRDALERVENGVLGLYSRWWQMMIGAVIVLVSVIGVAFWLGSAMTKAGVQFP